MADHRPARHPRRRVHGRPRPPPAQADAPAARGVAREECDGNSWGARGGADVDRGGREGEGGAREEHGAPSLAAPRQHVAAIHRGERDRLCGAGAQRDRLRALHGGLRAQGRAAAAA
eukprot:4293648-Prymnesium_polylepis.1